MSKELLGARHYTCTSNKELESTPNSEKEHISYETLFPLVRNRLGREPIDMNELIVVSEQIIRDDKREK